jgi:hypothetical protein
MKEGVVPPCAPTSNAAQQCNIFPSLDLCQEVFDQASCACKSVWAHHVTPVCWCFADFSTGKPCGLAGNNNQQEDYADV